MNNISNIKSENNTDVEESCKKFLQQFCNAHQNNSWANLLSSMDGVSISTTEIREKLGENYIRCCEHYKLLNCG